MAQVMEPHPGQAGFVEKLPELPTEVTDLDGRSDRRCEYKSCLMPPRSSQQPFLRLLGLVVLQSLNYDAGQSDSAEALTRLRLDQSQLSGDPPAPMLDVTPAPLEGDVFPGEPTALPR